MKKINLAITGCMGRMGQQIIKSARSDKNFKIVALTENRIVNKKIHGIKPSLNTLEAFKKAAENKPNFLYALQHKSTSSSSKGAKASSKKFSAFN